MKKMKTILAVLMAAAMLLCAMPMAVLAEGEPTPKVLVQAASCNIGIGVGDTFEAATSVEANQSGLTLRVYFTGNEIPATGTAVEVGGGFIGQNATVNADNAAEGYIDITGIKCTGKDNLITVKWDGKLIVHEHLLEAPKPSAGGNSGTGDGGDKTPANLIIRSSSIGKESINAGDEFKLSLTIYATTSGNSNAEDVVVSVMPGEGVTVASGSSSTYVGAMAPGASKTVTFPMKALDSFTGNVTTIKVMVTGSGSGGDTTISVPIVQPDRFELTRVECPEILTAGEEDVISVIFVNKGKSPVNNVTVEFKGENVANPAQSEYVGNLPEGTENSVDFDVSALDAGTVSGVITVTYEDSNGNTVTKTQEFSTQADAAMSWDDYYPDDFGGEDYPMEGVEPEKAGLPVWAIAAIAAAVVAGVVIVVVVLKKRKAKKALAEAEDEDI